MMKLLAALLTAMVAAAIGYAALNKSVCDKIKVLRPTDPKEAEQGIEIKSVGMILLTLIVFLLSFLAAQKIYTSVSDSISIGRLLIVLWMLPGAAGVDLREHRIPNFFCLMIALAGAALMFAALILKQQGAAGAITTGMIACVVSVSMLLLASFVSKNGIGMGDVKLIGALALTSGIFCLVGTLFYGTLSCAATAAVLLLTKKIDRSGGVPFGPFLWCGFILTILTNNF